MSDNGRDRQIVRDLAKRYAEAAARDVQREKRDLWKKHNSLQRTRPLLLANVGMWNHWCKEFFGDDAMECEDGFHRDEERRFRLLLFRHETGDDRIAEPWVGVDPLFVRHPAGTWGLPEGRIHSEEDGGAYRIDPPLKVLDDIEKIVPPKQEIEEKATARYVDRARDLYGDIVPAVCARGPALGMWRSDISTDMIALRGLEQIMIDMIENPEWVHRLAAFMRDAILAVHEEAERAGDFTSASQINQAECYAKETVSPAPDGTAHRREELWWYAAAQEFTLVSPRMHEEFVLDYQIEILKKFRLVAYGCCENLTKKIDMLRRIPNLRRIAVTPTANVRECAEQIGADYVLSWRPNPTDMVCAGFDEAKIRRILKNGMEACKGCHVDLILKDVETLEREPDRMRRWVRIAREVTESYA
jgi:hypothetical protein